MEDEPEGEGPAPPPDAERPCLCADRCDPRRPCAHPQRARTPRTLACTSRRGPLTPKAPCGPGCGGRWEAERRHHRLHSGPGAQRAQEWQSRASGGPGDREALQSAGPGVRRPLSKLRLAPGSPAHAKQVSAVRSVSALPQRTPAELQTCAAPASLSPSTARLAPGRRARPSRSSASCEGPSAPRPGAGRPPGRPPRQTAPPEGEAGCRPRPPGRRPLASRPPAPSPLSRSPAPSPLSRPRPPPAACHPAEPLAAPPPWGA